MVSGSAGFAGPTEISIPVAPGNREYDELIAREIPIAPYEPPPVDLVAYAARRRWEIIEAATVDVGGVAVPADATTRAVVTAAYVQAVAASGFTIDPWKISPGHYVTLTAAQVIAIGDALSAYVQSMFAKNRDIDDAVAAGTITTTAEIDAAYAT
ncbi:DUF4376 domain-containing protein [Phreatobacter sp. AB_2022a]|uniref:DUF4376 domain-containing protein n=1 Tax=Phreatobacter sp. AB_2022a TaxID=3003134 RepID=UPI0022876307|nr:DUF4376 domain-containing protein [Phreatobacter sp. AB_2022a]MCZ0734601.1 DUF4376 domain-containing protein [Phreatobacter sp. AB_2022a]